jgi:elongation factor Ts
MAITAGMVKELREKTGAGMLDCKKALEEANGDLTKASEILREKGLAAAAKKSDRIASEGVVTAVVENGVAVVLEVNSETDFVAKNAQFQAFVSGITKQIAVGNPADVEALLAQKSIESEDTIENVVNTNTSVIGEKLSIRRFARYDVASGNVAASYVHGAGKVGVIIELNGGTAELAKDLAMQIAAAAPTYLSIDEVAAEAVEKEKAILLEQINNDDKNKNKPDNIKEKMVEGRLGKFFEDVVLLEQAFVKDDSLKVKQLLANANASIVRFDRFGLGEGLEKKQENFAEEVMAQVNQ